ncbi:MAG: ZIP family metal transporter [Methylococcaceae bacterium]|nr:MAG: ZIP family metal transporter [Methylococcaceae bacterium]
MPLSNLKPHALALLSRLETAVQDQPVYQAFRSMPAKKQKMLLIAVAASFSLALLSLMYAYISKIILMGMFASLVAGLATGLGALPTLYFKDISEKLLNVMLGGAAGVMLAATAFSLIVPGIDYGNLLWPGKGIYAMAFGMMLGILFLHYADMWFPHDHNLLLQSDARRRSLRKIWLFVIAITIHNFPEGLAVGVSFGAEDWRNGLILAIAIGLQNMPEGLAVALPLAALGYDRRKAVWVATFTGLVEPVGGILGVTAVTVFKPLLPMGMGFAAGAMLFVICDEIIPEIHTRKNTRAATFGIMGGFIVMMMLDNAIR